MKKLSLNFLFMMGLMASLFFACDDDENGVDVIPPTISSPDDITIEAGEDGTISFSVTANGGYRSATVTSSATDIATATISTNPLNNTTNSGTVVVTVTGVAEGSSNITLTVTDQQDQESSDEVRVTVDPEAETPDDGDAPEISAAVLDTAADGNLTTLSDALEAIGLFDDLADADAITIFAPNNDAFADLLTAQGAADLPALVAALTEDGVAGVLRAHVVADSLGEAEADAAAGGSALATLNSGATIIITKEGENLFANGAQILTTDILIANGVIHVIDSVINTDIGDEESTIDASQAPRESIQAYLESDFTGNAIVDPMLGGVASTADGLNPIPSAPEVTTNIAPYPSDAFYTPVNYKGAFDPSATTTWLDGWSLLSKAGYLATGTAQGTEAAYDPNTATIVEVASPITGDVNWTADNVYRITGYTFVEDGTLTIAPGTVVIAAAKADEDSEASALIVTTTATIEADGTAENPIIFTSELDDGSLLPTDVGQWGGLVVLGTAPAEAGGATSNIQIEGIESDAGNSTYGGEDAADDSGTLRYLSIRHTGDILGNGDEVQGLTLGGVGSGTTIEYVECIGSNDDGVEIFGGTVNIKYFAVAYQTDDAFDFDQGWSGKGQFLFSYAIPGDIEAPGEEAGDFVSDHAGEWDGFDEGDASTALTSDFEIYNATFVGAGQTSSRSTANPAILVRENAEVVIANSIITNFNGKAINIQDAPDTDTGDSFAKFQAGEIDLLGNIYNVNPSYTDFSSGDTGIVVGE